MQQDELRAAFDQQAAGYDRQWARMAPIRTGLYFFLESLFEELPETARVLCVGAGTGQELAHLARTFPSWRFTAVEPSRQMLDICRQRCEQEGFASRCSFHEGYVESLPPGDLYDAATCLLVSQFILDQRARAEFFRSIGNRLRPGGILASSDLASDTGSREYEALLRLWMNVMSGAGVPPEALERMRTAYANDVAVLVPRTVASIIESGGFEPPVQFYQAGLIHAWFSRRATENAAQADGGGT